MRRIDAEVDGDGRDALVGARQSVGLCFNLQTDLIKVHKLAAFAVQELCVFYRERRRSVNKPLKLNRLGGTLTSPGLQRACFTVNQLEDEGTTGDDARSPGQKVPGGHRKFDMANRLKTASSHQRSQQHTHLLLSFISLTPMSLRLSALLTQGLTYRAVGY